MIPVVPYGHMQVTKAEGVAGLYRGFTSVLVGALPGNMAYFGGYEVGKSVRAPPHPAGGAALRGTCERNAWRSKSSSNCPLTPQTGTRGSAGWVCDVGGVSWWSYEGSTYGKCLGDSLFWNISAPL